MDLYGPPRMQPTKKRWLCDKTDDENERVWPRLYTTNFRFSFLTPLYFLLLLFSALQTLTNFFFYPFQFYRRSAATSCNHLCFLELLLLFIFYFVIPLELIFFSPLCAFARGGVLQRAVKLFFHSNNELINCFLSTQMAKVDGRCGKKSWFTSGNCIN